MHRLRNSPQGWGLVAMLLHWLSLPLLAAALGIGWWAEHLAAPSQQLRLYEVHFSLGLLALGATFARLVWRCVDKRPPTMAGVTRLQRFAASTVHFLLYLSLIAALVSGTVNFLFLGPVRVFGAVWIPRLFDPEADEPLRALAWYAHHYSWPLFGLLVCLHAAAALHHHFVRRDRLLADFWPQRRVTGAVRE
jgi:cytochrome b561